MAGLWSRAVASAHVTLRAMSFNGLPLHILLVHIVVIAVPVAALCAVLTAAWPAARRRLGIVTPLIAFVSLVCIPITTEAGEALQEQIKETPLSQIHVNMGKQLLPWVVGLFLVTALQWIWYRYVAGSADRTPRVSSRGTRIAVTIVLALLVALTAVGSTVTAFQIGESGARAVWNGIAP